MFARIRRSCAAPVFERDAEKTRLARLLHGALLAILLTAALGSLVIIAVEPLADLAFNLVFGLVMVAIVVILMALLRRGHVRAIGALLSFLLWASITFILANSNGIGNATAIGYPLLLFLAGLLLGEQLAYLLTFLSSAAAAALFYAEVSGYLGVPPAAMTGPSELAMLIAALLLTALLVRFVTRSISQALEQARLKEIALRERNRELESSQRVTFAASERVSPDELLGLVVDMVRDQFDLYHVQVYIVDEEREAAVLRESTGYAGYQLLQQEHQIPLDRPALVTRAIREGRPVLVPDVSQEPSFMPNPLLPETRSELVIPLRVGDRVFGALDAQDRAAGRFTESTQTLFQTMIDQIAFLFENTELLERVSDQAEELTVFTNHLRTAADVAERLSTILDSEQLLQQTVELMQSRFGLYHAHIYLLDEEMRKLDVHIGSGEIGRVLRERGHSIPLDKEKSLVARTARNREIVLVDDTSQEPDFMPNPLLPQTRSEMAVPLMVGNEVLGVLDLQDDRVARFTQADRDTFSVLAGQIATGLQNARLFEEQRQTRAALRESEDRYRDLIEHTHDLISTHDLQGQILSVNHEITRVLGYDRRELLEMNIRDLLPPEFKEDFDQYLAKIKREGVASGLISVQTSAGDRRIWEYDNILRTDADSEPVVRTMAHDITEAKQAERALRESEAKYRTLFANIADPIVIFDKESKLFLDCNQATVERYGYSLEELRSMTPHQFHPSEDFEQVDERIDDEEDDAPHRYVHVTKSGERMSVEVHTAPIEYGGRDAWISIIRDVTERERRERERKRFTDQLRTAAELSKHINSILAPGELLREVVVQLCDRFDLYQAHVYLLDEEGQDLVVRAGSGEAGEALCEREHKVSLECESDPVAQAARDRIPVLINDIVSNASFEPNPLLPATRSEVAAPLVAGSQVLGVLDVQDTQANRFSQSDLDVLSTLAGHIAISLQNAGLFEEIHETTARLRKADYLKGDLLSRLNHELRTPLNSILGYTEIMLMSIDGELNPRNLKHVQAINDNGRQLFQVISDALDLARIEAGELSLELEEIRVNSLIDEVSSGVARMMDDRPIEWIVEVEDDLPPIQGDRARLNQALNGVIANAFKLTNEGHVKLCAFSDDGWVYIEVQDTGLGIEEADLASMLARLRKSGFPTKPRAGVTSLDLVVTCHLVQMHGGEIDAHRQPTSGNVFTIKLPTLPRAAEAAGR